METQNIEQETAPRGKAAPPAAPEPWGMSDVPQGMSLATDRPVEPEDPGYQPHVDPSLASHRGAHPKDGVPEGLAPLPESERHGASAEGEVDHPVKLGPHHGDRGEWRESKHHQQQRPAETEEARAAEEEAMEGAGAEPGNAAAKLAAMRVDERPKQPLMPGDAQREGQEQDLGEEAESYRVQEGGRGGAALAPAAPAQAAPQGHVSDTAAGRTERVVHVEGPADVKVIVDPQGRSGEAQGQAGQAAAHGQGGGAEGRESRPGPVKHLPVDLPPPPQPEAHGELPGFAEPSARHEKFTQPPLDKIEAEQRRREREAHEAQVRERQREKEERESERKERIAERKEHKEEEKTERVSSLLRESVVSFREICDAEWARAVTMESTPGAMAQAARSFLRELASSKALIFLDHHKTGLIISGDSGYGFVAVREESPESESLGRWLGPSFLSIGGVGLGASAGRARTRSLVFVTQTEEAERLRKGGTEFTVATNMTLSAVGEKLEGGVAAGGPVRGTNQIYSISDGSLVDLSLGAVRIKHDLEANRIAFGTDAKPEEILSGAVPPHPALTALGEEIQSYVDNKKTQRVGNVDIDPANEERVAPKGESFLKVLF